MTPRPFYRSRLFWLGLPGLVFLLWGWRISNRYTSAMVTGDGERFWWFAQSRSELTAVWDSDGIPERGLFEVQHTKLKPVETARWRNTLAEKAELDPTYRYIIIPYYTVLLAYMATWLLNLAWWQRRKSRLMKLHNAP